MKKLLKKIGIVVGVFLMFCLIVGIFTPSSDTHKEGKKANVSSYHETSTKTDMKRRPKELKLL